MPLPRNKEKPDDNPDYYGRVKMNFRFNTTDKKARISLLYGMRAFYYFPLTYCCGDNGLNCVHSVFGFLKNN